MKKYCILILSIFLLACFSGIQKKNKESEIRYSTNKIEKQSFCDSIKIFFFSIAEAKVKYEECLYKKDSVNLEKEKLRYHALVNQLISNKIIFTECLQHLLDKERIHKSEYIVVFEYKDPYSSYLGKCTAFIYEDYYLLLLYNLAYLKVNESELHCK